MKTLDQLIRKTLIENNRSIHHYYLFYSFAVSAIKDFNIDHFGDSRTVSLELGKSVALSADVSHVYDVGVLNGGHFLSFERGDSMDVDTFRKASAAEGSGFVYVKIEDGAAKSTEVGMSFMRGNASPVPVDSLIGDPTSSYVNTHGESLGGFYGAELDNKNRFKIDYNGSDIAIMAPGVTESIAIRFMAGKEDVNPSSIIHPAGENFVVAAIRHYHADRTRTADRYEKATAMEQFYGEYEKYMSRLTRLTPEQLIQSLNRATSQTPKK